MASDKITYMPKTQLSRCAWCLQDPMYIQYHDQEWGKPIYDDEQLFAMLCLEAMQAGLSWLMILKRRENYYHAFDGFDAQKISQYDDDKIDELMQNAGIIRHRKKIEAIVANAKAYLAIQKSMPFGEYLWAMTTHDKQPVINNPKCLADVPTQNDVSCRLAKQLKKDGFKFIGATTCYAFMQAVGMVDDHLIHCAFKSRQATKPTV